MLQCKCVHCDKKFKVNDEFGGKRIRCPQCKEVVLIPKAPEAALPSTPNEARPAPTPRQKPSLPAVVPEEHSEEFLDDYSEPQLPAPTRRNKVHRDDRYQSSQIHIQPTSNVQVNVRNSHSSNSLGISSLILGLLSFVICWMPVFGQLISGLGLCLGLLGFILAIVRGGTGIGYAISGAVLNGLSLLVGIVFVSFLGATADQLSSVGIADRAKVPQAVPSQPDSTNKAANATKPDNAEAPGAGLTNVPAVSPPVVAVPPQAETQTPLWHPATESLQLGDISLKISSVVQGAVPLHQKIGDSETESKESLLAIYVELTNTSQSKKIDYKGWMNDYARLLDLDAELTDNHDNDYRKVNFAALLTVKGIATDSSIYPGKTIKDAIVFEQPVPGIEFLRLKLSAKGMGQDGEFRLEIPADMIRMK